MAKLTQKYETMLVLSTKLGEDGIAQTVEKFKDLISSHGVLETVDEWGKRRLAYPINYETEGYYVLFQFESNPEFPSELNRIYNITDGILRTLIIAKEDA